ncbi:MAG: hypothetical protein LBI85_04085 [Spirochaetaceae bacterium]|jgi:hypothetical protein|nr:hypothetical protein [Spirochaetaceae bacterium]
MKRRGILIFFLCFGSIFLAAQAPDWYLDKEGRYPSSRYISALGEGTGRAEAEASAIAAISLFFNTTTEIRNQAIREFNEAVANDTTEFTKKTYITENAVIRSETDFLGIRFTSPWENTRSRTWAVLAYIDRLEAASIYESKINTASAAMRTLGDDAARETDNFYAASLLYRAFRMADLTEELIKTAALVDTGASQKYAGTLGLISRIRSDYRSRRGNLNFGLTVEGDRNGRVERALGALLESSGYLIARQNPAYLVSVILTSAEENLPSGVFIRPGVTLRIERGGAVLFSYSKNYTRYGHITLDGAYNRAFLAVERDLEENFIAKLTASVGR